MKGHERLISAVNELNLLILKAEKRKDYDAFTGKSGTQYLRANPNHEATTCLKSENAKEHEFEELYGYDAGLRPAFYPEALPAFEQLPLRAGYTASHLVLTWHFEGVDSLKEVFQEEKFPRLEKLSNQLQATTGPEQAASLVREADIQQEISQLDSMLNSTDQSILKQMMDQILEALGSEGWEIIDNEETAASNLFSFNYCKLGKGDDTREVMYTVFGPMKNVVYTENKKPQK